MSLGCFPSVIDPRDLLKPIKCTMRRGGLPPHSQIS